jgi:hypothetical protein
MRRENVGIQKWNLSCGAAALDILLRYEHGDLVPAPSPAQCALAFHPFERRLPTIRIPPPGSPYYLKQVGGIIEANWITRFRD